MHQPSPHPPTRSIPGLATALRHTDRQVLPLSTAAQLQEQALVPLYQVEGVEMDAEVQSAVHTISLLADKLRRMASAYGEWQIFDIPAFFDLYPSQVNLLMDLSERATMVHTYLYADLLLPSFQRSERYWAEEFFPAYHAAHPLEVRTDKRNVYTDQFFDIIQPKMIAYWERTLAVVKGVRYGLSEDIGFLAAAGGSEERVRWQRRQAAGTAAGLDGSLLAPIANLPTLTLSISFPLPSHRQPGRLRRLRRIWRRKGWRRS